MHGRLNIEAAELRQIVGLAYAVQRVRVLGGPGWADSDQFDIAAKAESADATRDDVLLAYAMNGDELPREHGAPLRLLVPGWYGMASVKWLARLRLVERRFEGFFQARRYVVGERPLREIAPRALIAWPRDDDRLPARPFVVRGYAWDGRGSLARVDVSADGGRSWRDATLDDALSPYAWRQWHASVAPGTSGQLVVMARAVTTDGDEQPLALEVDRHVVDAAVAR